MGLRWRTQRQATKDFLGPKWFVLCFQNESVLHVLEHGCIYAKIDFIVFNHQF